MSSIYAVYAYHKASSFPQMNHEPSWNSLPRNRDDGLMGEVGDEPDPFAHQPVKTTSSSALWLFGGGLISIFGVPGEPITSVVIMRL